jgi:hypothetical protein
VVAQGVHERSTLGELSTFQLILYVTVGDLIQQAVTQQDAADSGAPSRPPVG